MQLINLYLGLQAMLTDHADELYYMCFGEPQM